MVGEYVKRPIGLLGGAHSGAAGLLYTLKDRGVQVSLVDGTDLLYDRDGAFEAQARVDTGTGQGRKCAVLVLLVLVKD